MADLSTYTKLVTPQHADKPKFMAMLAAVLGCFVDQQNVLASLPGKFDVDTAVGVQLDAVGLWVGISRNLAVPITGTYFSWDTEGLGWDEGSWQGPFDPTSGISALDDTTYRVLLKAKIGANHWDGTMPGAKAILDQIFPESGTPHTQVATAATFSQRVSGTTYQLAIGGVPVYGDVTVSALHRTQWGVRERLYPMPRTNLALHSEDFSNAVWQASYSGTGSAAVVTPNYAAAPDGTMTACRVQLDLGAATGDQDWSAFQQDADSPDGTETGALWIRSNTGSDARVYLYTLDALVLATVTPQWQLIEALETDPANQDDGPTSTTADLLIWHPQVEASAAPGVHIPTTNAPATLTDYSVDGQGLVTLAELPATGAVLDWDGSGTAYPKGTHVFIQDSLDMSISFAVSGAQPSQLLRSILSQGLLPLKPEAVHVDGYVMTSVDGAPIFGLDIENSYIAGLDVGALAIDL